MNIITEQPLWFLLFCLLCGALYAAVLYFRDKKNDFSSLLSLILAIIRFLSVSLIAFLLLSPLLKTIVRQVEKPIIIFANDASESVTMLQDSTWIRTSFHEQLGKVMDELSGDYQTASYSFGDRVREGIEPVYDDKTSNLSALFEDIRSRYLNRNVGALVISTDGIYNRGQNPLFTAEKIPFPVYTVAMGDTVPRKDLLIAKVNFNNTVFLGSKFPLEIQIKANLLQGSNYLVEIVRNQQVLFSKQLVINSGRYLENILTSLETTSSGLQHYQVRISRLEGEITYDNNEKDIYIRVLEGKEKILLLYAAPHPDIAAIRSGIESNANLELSVIQASEFAGSIQPFNLIILHQLPSGTFPLTNLVSKAGEDGIPLLFILGQSSNLPAFNNLKYGLSIQQEKNSFTESQPSLNANFSLFTLAEEHKRLIQDFPPLTTAFGSVKTLASATTLFYQRINNLTTDRPLILFGQEPNRKYGVIAGEGIWRWKLSNYLAKSNHDAFNELISKMVQYLSIRLNKDLFRVYAGFRYVENEAVTLTAEVYNPSYELVNEGEVEVTITGEDGQHFPYVFSRSGNAYQLNAGLLPAGIYTYVAQTRLGDNILRASGEFTVAPLQIEKVNTRADHHLLFNLAAQSGGEMIYPADLMKLPSMIKSREDVKSIAYTRKKYTDLNNLPWVLGLILLLLSLEWFLRKRAGSY
ncbi:MAG TPA: hypothetical protein P5531_04460 [Bacteroidales bacterium]|nr:hypothetical protein [Bacteroidales bacterium]HSA42745.1 hypothetical protein [Bacteroidales bacterium]